MRNPSIVALGLVSVLGLSGCAGLAAPLAGGIYTDMKFPSIASQTGPGPKTGTAQAHAYFGMVALGDASVATACSNGGITKISTVDAHGTTILGIYSTWTTIVTGQ